MPGFGNVPFFSSPVLELLKEALCGTQVDSQTSGNNGIWKTVIYIQKNKPPWLLELNYDITCCLPSSSSTISPIQTKIPLHLNIYILLCIIKFHSRACHNLYSTVLHDGKLTDKVILHCTWKMNWLPREEME